MNKTEKNFSVFSRKDSKIFANEYFLKKIKDNYDVVNGFDLKPIKSSYVNNDLSFANNKQNDNNILTSLKNNNEDNFVERSDTPVYNFSNSNNQNLYNQNTTLSNTKSNSNPLKQDPFADYDSNSTVSEQWNYAQNNQPKKATNNNFNNVTKIDSDFFGFNEPTTFLNDDHLGMDISDFLIDDDPFLNYINSNDYSNKSQSYKSNQDNQNNLFAKTQQSFDNLSTDYLDDDINTDDYDYDKTDLVFDLPENDKLSNLLSTYNVNDNIFSKGNNETIEDFSFLSREQIKEIVTEKLGYCDERMLDDLHSKSIFENWKELDLQKWLLNPENINMYKKIDFESNKALIPEIKDDEQEEDNSFNKSENHKNVKELENKNNKHHHNGNKNNGFKNNEKFGHGNWWDSLNYSKFFYNLKHLESCQKNNDLIMKMEMKQNYFESKVQSSFDSLSNEIKELNSKFKATIIEESYKTLLLNNQTEVLKNYFNEKFSFMTSDLSPKKDEKSPIKNSDDKLEGINEKISEISKSISNIYSDLENSKIQNNEINKSLRNIKDEIYVVNEKLNSRNIISDDENLEEISPKKNNVEDYKDNNSLIENFINRFNNQVNYSNINLNNESINNEKLDEVKITKIESKESNQIAEIKTIDRNINDSPFDLIENGNNQLDLDDNQIEFEEEQNQIEINNNVTNNDLIPIEQNNDVLTLNDVDYLNKNKLDSFLDVNKIIWNDNNQDSELETNKEEEVKEQETLNDVISLPEFSFLVNYKFNFFIGVNEIKWSDIKESDMDLEDNLPKITDVILTNNNFIYLDGFNPSIKQAKWPETFEDELEIKSLQKQKVNRYENRFKSLNLKKPNEQNIVKSISYSELKDYENNDINFLYKSPNSFDFKEEPIVKKPNIVNKNEMVIKKEKPLKVNLLDLSENNLELSLNTNEFNIETTSRENEIVKKVPNVVAFNKKSPNLLNNQNLSDNNMLVNKRLINEKDSLKNENINYNEFLEELNLKDEKENVAEKIKKEKLEGNEKKIDDFKNNVLMELDDIINNLQDLNIKDDSIYDIENLKAKFKNI